MKLDRAISKDSLFSRPRKGAWIEIGTASGAPATTASRPRKGAWIEISIMTRTWPKRIRRPRKGAWIEIETK